VLGQEVPISTPYFAVSARSAQRDWIWVNADLGQRDRLGLLRPGVLPHYRLRPEPVTFGLYVNALPARAG
jgi:hypothetical protein